MAINYQEIVENLKDEKVKELLYQLGAEDVIEKDDCLITNTICHNEDVSDASMKLYYYKDSHIFYCYTECGGMSIFNFLKHYYETRNIQYDWFKDVLQVVLNCSASIATSSNPLIYKSHYEDYVNKDVKKLEVYPNGILDMFIKYYPYEWLKDGITKEAMDKYGIRYSPVWNKIIIPHYNVDGELVGIRGRALNPEEAEEFGKYMPIQIEGKFYNHPLSLNLYGLHLNKEAIKETGMCFIFESEKSVLQFEDFTLPNCAVAGCGSNINKFQIDLLMRTCAPRNIVICFDREEKKGEEKYFNKLYAICNKYKNYANMSFIYDRKGISKMKDSPSDNGQEIFERLLKERVRVK